MGRTGLQRGRYTYILNDINNHFARIKWCVDTVGALLVLNIYSGTN